MTKRWAHIGFDTILDVWYPGHGIIQRGHICDDGFLIWMGHIDICTEQQRWKKTVMFQGNEKDG